MDSAEVSVIVARVDHVHEEVKKLSASYEKVSEALLILARLESAHNTIIDRLRDAGDKFKDHETRLKDIEANMPGLKELRKWVMLGILSGVGMMFAALFKLVILDPSVEYSKQQDMISTAVERALNAQEKRDK